MLRPPRGSSPAVPFQNFRGQSRLRGGQAEAAAEVNLLPPAVNIGVTHRDDRDRSVDPALGKTRQQPEDTRFNIAK